MANEIRVGDFKITSDGRNYIVNTMKVQESEKSKKFGEEYSTRTSYLSSAKSLAIHICDEVLHAQIQKGEKDLAEVLEVLITELNGKRAF